MQRVIIIFLVALLIPTSAFAARSASSFLAGRSLVAASSSPGNAYFAGVSVVSTAPVAGDLSTIGGSIITAAPVQGDLFVLAGSARLRESISGDLRAVGWSINIESLISGDLAAFGFSVRNSGRATGNTFVIAAEASLLNGSSGPVTVYGNSILLAGDFAGNVKVISTGRLSLADDTVIRGTLSYEAPETAVIPDSAIIEGGIEYTNAAYLPGADTSRILAIVSIGFFLLARIFGALILAGLLAGLFPRLAEAVVEYAYRERFRDILLTILLGFAILVATPILIILLTLTFVGIGLALLLLIVYALLATLALLYAGILIGGMLARRFAKRETVLWRDGMIGMLALSFMALVPIIGSFMVFLLTMFAAGTLLQIFFHSAFPRDEHISKMP